MKSCDKNDPEGRYKIGLFHERGYVNSVTSLNLSSDELLKKALDMYKQAAGSKHNEAIVDLGYIYETGLKDSKNNNFIEKQNLTQAKLQYETVDLDNCPRACNNLGTLSLK